MYFRKLLSVPTLCFLAAAVAAGCSDVTSPDSQSSDPGASSTIDDELSLMAAGGAEVSGGIGVFSITWDDRRHPFEDGSQSEGHAFAVGFTDEAEGAPPFCHAGIDMGSVFLSWNETQIEVPKREGRRGEIVYSTFSPPFEEEGPPVDFVPGTAYEFEVTGSDLFDPITFSVTSPPALIDITSHDDGEQISGDLTITWEGGEESEPVIVHVTAHRPRRPGHGPRPGPGPRPGEGIFVVLETNTGEYTVTEDQIERLLSGVPANMIRAGVGQHVDVAIPHGEGEIRAIVHNGDGVVLGVL